ncbi:DUF6950 family protein [Mongoliimonas terrestris]|uniref:DUF6950 family protein n=1 Tax=Mongoliimonas terrestris TaxID=1709001 RepID=UPI0009496A4D|nr:hypothetical protein [Mongoliimonas terrestris]
MTLTEWIRATSGEPFRPGWSECAGWALRWVQVARMVDVSPWMPPDGVDPADYVAAAGGLEALAAGAAAGLCLEPTDMPERGDVGVIVVVRTAVAGICTGPDRWAVKSKDRVVFIDAKAVLAAWRV